MRIKKNGFLFCCTVAFFLVYLSSCQSPHFYRPKSLEPVLLTQEKQVTLNITSGELPAYSIAYSPLSNFGLQAGAGHRIGNNTTYDETYFNPYLSAGYYKKVSSAGLAEIYGGAGIYSYKNKIDAPVKSINFSNYFLQPSFALLYKNIDVAFTLRTDYLKRNKTVLDTNAPPDMSSRQYSFLKYDNYFFFQPGVTVRGGIKNVKLVLQMSKSIPFSSQYSSLYGFTGTAFGGPDMLDNNVKMAIGLMLDFEDIIRLKSK